jgi:hypothetical protein
MMFCITLRNISDTSTAPAATVSSSLSVSASFSLVAAVDCVSHYYAPDATPMPICPRQLYHVHRVCVRV